MSVGEVRTTEQKRDEKAMAITLDVDPPIGPGFDEEVCFRCADEIDCNDEAVTAPVGETGGLKMVAPMHTWCAVQDGFRLRWRA